ncbi:hypothetical protein D9M69_417580 [compost metagenome]
MMGLDALADQIWMGGISRARERPVATCTSGGLLPLGPRFFIVLLLTLLTLTGVTLPLDLLGKQVALWAATKRQPQLPGDNASGIDLPAAAQVGQQRHEVATFIAAGEVVPFTGVTVDAERPGRAVTAHRIDCPILFALASAIRQPVGQQIVGSEQSRIGDALNLNMDRHQCKTAGAVTMPVKGVAAFHYWHSNCLEIQASTSNESQPTTCAPAMRRAFGKRPSFIKL